MSFIDLMASTVWTEADIVRRTEEIIHGAFSVEAELILNRKVTGAAIGVYQPTPDEQAELGRYAAICEAARQEGNAARADMALLTKVLEVEAAHRVLLLPEVEPVLDENGAVTNQAEYDAYEAQRQAAVDVVNAADEETMALVALRNPPEPDPVP